MPPVLVVPVLVPPFNPSVTFAFTATSPADSAMQGTTGITGAAPIWHAVMAHVLAGVADRWPAVPAGLRAANTSWGVAYFMPGTDATTGELHDELARRGADLMLRALAAPYQPI